MQFEDRVTLSTPEGVDLDVALAGVGSRFAAALLDALLQLALIYGLPLIVAFGMGMFGAASGESLGWVLLSLWFIWFFLVFFGYDVLFETLNNGRTVGKMAVGIRVVRVGGGPVGFITSAVRNLLRIVDILPGMYAVGMISVLVTTRNQRLGDLAAGTLVVRDATRAQRGVATTQHPGIYPPVQSPPAVAAPLDPSLQAWDVSAVTTEDLAAIRSFLERRHTLQPGPRWALAVEMSRRLAPKISGAPTGLHPEVFLELVFTAKSSRS
ncbi:MAG: RDD family protein [Actinomycetota bacterium]|nr:RDD family protein [Actinomycetota bacterium]